MIDLDDWIRELDEQPDREIIDHAAYQKQLFSEYVIRNDDNKEKRQELLKRFKNGETLSGEKGLRKELAAFDLGYFGRAYLSHYFVRKSPAFQLKFGGDKGRIAMIGAFGVLAVISIVIVKGAEAIFNVDLVSLVDNMRTISMGVLITIIIIIALLMLLVSMKISLSIMNKKEF